MANKFRKQMLAVGTYKSPDGTVEVTPDRLRHWQSQFARMTAAQQVVPMHFDHSDNPDELQPVALDLFKSGQRSAANAVGKMIGFDLADDGQSATVVFEPQTTSAIEAFEGNSVQISPVLLPEWKDGHGNEYTDVIGHLDAVVHPVDHSQGPAERVEDAVCCALRMGLDVKPYRLAQQPPGEGDKPTEDGKAGEGEGNGTSGSGSQSELQEVLTALGKIGLTLPSDTTEDNFYDRMRTVAIAHAGANGEEEGMADKNTEVVDPQIATMSLQARQALAFGEKQHRSAVTKSLDELLSDGRCSPAEHAEKKKAIGVMKLSLNDAGEPQTSPVEDFIASRQAVPKGTFWSDEQKLKRMSAVPHPDPVNVDASGEEPDYDKAADFVLGK